MPTKRTRRLRDRAVIRPSVLAYLETGNFDECRRDNEWLIISLMAPAGREARAAWQAGNEAEARARLALCPAAHNLFIA